MPLYNESSKCPVCGTKTTVTINAHGDYDGPDGPRETDPCSCATCAGIKLANPEMFKRLMALWEQIKDERNAHEKQLAEVRSGRYTEHDLYSIFHTPYLDETLSRLYDKELRSNARHVSNKDLGDPWVRKTTAKRFAFEIIKIAIGKRKVSPTYR